MTIGYNKTRKADEVEMYYLEPSKDLEGTDIKYLEYAISNSDITKRTRKCHFFNMCMLMQSFGVDGFSAVRINTALHRARYWSK